MVYFNKVNGDEPVVTGKKVVSQQIQQPNQKKVQVVPVGQNNDKQDDIDSLPQGYYVEKSETAVKPLIDDDDDKQDTQIHPDDIVEMSESITIANDEIRPITEALDNAVRRGQNISLKKLDTNSNVDDITNAESMMKHDTFKLLDMDYRKGLNADALARFEYDNFKYSVEEAGSTTKWQSNSERIDVKATYESKSGNTKMFGYLKGAITNNKTSFILPKSDNTEENQNLNDDNGNSRDEIDIPPMPDLLNVKSSNNEYCIYMGVKQKFKNGNVLSATGFHDKNEQLSANTTQFDALYDLGFADVTGSASIYKIGHVKSSVKTNISCKFKTPETSEPQSEQVDQQDEQAVQSADDEQKKQTTETNNKKWVRKSGLLLEFESEDDNEQGIGYYWNFKKNENNSKTKFTVFGKGSTTQRSSEKSSYHITAGANFDYNQRINSKTRFDLNLDAKNKITFGGVDKGNITTAFGTARLNSKNKFIVELEGKLILAHDIYQTLALRFARKFNKKVEASLETVVVNQNETGTKLKGVTSLATIHVKL